jgi:hypothetical protein
VTHQEQVEFVRRLRDSAASPCVDEAVLRDLLREAADQLIEAWLVERAANESMRDVERLRDFASRNVNAVSELRFVGKSCVDWAIHRIQGAK